MFGKKVPLGEKFCVKVCANGCWGVANLEVSVEYKGNAKQFIEDCMDAVFRRGYTSILSIVSIDKYMIPSFLEHVMNDGIYNKVLGVLFETRFFHNAIEQIQAYMKGEENDGNVGEYNGKYIYKGGWDIERCRQECYVRCNYIRGIKDALECMGVDVDGREAQRMINKNMGIDRV